MGDWLTVYPCGTQELVDSPLRKIDESSSMFIRLWKILEDSDIYKMTVFYISFAIVSNKKGSWHLSKAPSALSRIPMQIKTSGSKDSFSKTNAISSRNVLCKRF